jgi:hypothetical protein
MGINTVNGITPISPAGAATSAKQDAEAVLIGAVTESAPATDTASSGLNGRLQRIAQRVSSLIALIPAALTGSGNFKVAVQEALPAGDNNIGNMDVASVAIPTTIYNGQETVDAAGTAQAIVTTQAILSGVTVKALAGNAGLVYVGNASVAAANGFELAAGEQVFVEAADVASVYIDAATNDDGVSWIAS